jgi:predicted N-acetyltransferase YhbS
MQPIRQGDVILLSVASPHGTKHLGHRLDHLTLVEGEVTGHRHRIVQGNAELYEHGYEPEKTRYLRIISPTATLVHEEHRAMMIPQGDWLVRIQREYEPEGWHTIAD